MSTSGRRIEVRGIVQGVGFRPWVYRLAHAAGVSGRVRNDDGGVTIEAFGAEADLDAFLVRLRESTPAAASLCDVSWQPFSAEAPAGFEIARSRTSGRPAISIPADLATCADCLAEIFDPANRRFRYAFTNCTSCGPRFTIARDVPYDRDATAMAPFVMCEACRREYDDPEDRRFHAEANACPVCGPRLALRAPRGEDLPVADPIQAAARVIEGGRILALKGMGGFHLACDATSPFAVRRLRERKRRDEKPLAVMVRDLAAAERLARLDEAERRLLVSVERPIVLATRRPGGSLAEEVAPDTPLIGVFLPYTPLHHLLLAETERPLVMTSGNVSEEPIACDDAEALERLGAIADLFLLHDRAIEMRADDSVARVVAGAPVVLRRARGYVPRSVTVREAFVEPVLACGAHLKNTFCLGVGRAATCGPHVGDLENLETFWLYEESIARMERFLGVSPRVIAHDLHPDYLSTAYALGRAGALRIPVQHHHAHVASAMAEHGLAGPVLGVAYDGAGYGTDGASWGGEILLADHAGFQRLATFRPLRLAGGDRAIREVWRIALAALDDAFAGAPPLEGLPLFRTVPEEALRVVRQMLAGGLNTPAAHGAGRYFDALGALVLGCGSAAYEGQVALRWNLVADPEEVRPYPLAFDDAVEPRQLDLRPMVRAAVEDLLAGKAAATIAGRFHATLAEATAELVRAAANRVGRHAVVLTGGCFQNALLAERIIRALRPDFAVHLHSEVPPGDGGLALGQAVIANARLRAESTPCA